MLGRVGKLREPVLRRKADHFRGVESGSVLGPHQCLVVGHQEAIFEIGANRMAYHTFPQQTPKLSFRRTVVLIFDKGTD